MNRWELEGFKSRGAWVRCCWYTAYQEARQGYFLRQTFGPKGNQILREKRLRWESENVRSEDS